MIKVADDEILVAIRDEQMQQRDGIAPAGNADEVAIGWREIAKEPFWLNQRVALLRLHRPNVQRSTLNVQRSKYSVLSGEHRLAACREPALLT